MKMLKKKNKKQEVVKVEPATDAMENALRILALTIAGFSLEEFEEAEKKVEFLKSLGEVAK